MKHMIHCMFTANMGMIEATAIQSTSSFYLPGESFSLSRSPATNVEPVLFLSDNGPECFSYHANAEVNLHLRSGLKPWASRIFTPDVSAACLQPAAVVLLLTEP